jgi:hypothetical protein
MENPRERETDFKLLLAQTCIQMNDRHTQTLLRLLRKDKSIQDWFVDGISGFLPMFLSEDPNNQTKTIRRKLSWP